MRYVLSCLASWRIALSLTILIATILTIEFGSGSQMRHHVAVYVPPIDGPITPQLAFLPHDQPHDIISLVKLIIDLNAGMSVEEMNAVGGVKVGMKGMPGNGLITSEFTKTSEYVNSRYYVKTSFVFPSGNKYMEYRVVLYPGHSENGCSTYEKDAIRHIGGKLVTPDLKKNEFYWNQVDFPARGPITKKISYGSGDIYIDFSESGCVDSFDIHGKGIR